jgi:hypothetical protein
VFIVLAFWHGCACSLFWPSGRGVRVHCSRLLAAPSSHVSGCQSAPWVCAPCCSFFSTPCSCLALTTPNKSQYHFTMQAASSMQAHVSQECDAMQAALSKDDHAEMIKHLDCLNAVGQNLLHLIVISKKAHTMDWLSCNLPKIKMIKLYKHSDNFGKLPWQHGGFHWRLLGLE